LSVELIVPPCDCPCTQVQEALRLTRIKASLAVSLEARPSTLDALEEKLVARGVIEPAQANSPAACRLKRRESWPMLIAS